MYVPRKETDFSKCVADMSFFKLITYSVKFKSCSQSGTNWRDYK